MIATMKDEELNAITANITARVPYPIKIKIQERAMRYRMNLNEYMNIMIGAISKNEDLMNPDKIEEMSSAIGQLQAVRLELDQANETITKLSSDLDKYRSAYGAESKKALTLAAKIDSANKDALKTNELVSNQVKHLKEKLENYSKKVRELTSQNKQLTEQVKAVTDRLNKANKRLKDENITEGPFLGPQKVVQF